MSVVQRPPAIQFSSMTRNRPVAVNELMHTAAGGQALCNFCSSHLPVFYSESKSGPRRRKVFFTRRKELQGCVPGAGSVLHPLTQMPGSPRELWSLTYFLHASEAVHTMFCRLGCPSSSLGMGGLYLILDASSNAKDLS